MASPLQQRIAPTSPQLDWDRSSWAASRTQNFSSNVMHLRNGGLDLGHAKASSTQLLRGPLPVRAPSRREPRAASGKPPAREQRKPTTNGAFPPPRRAFIMHFHLHCPSNHKRPPSNSPRSHGTHATSLPPQREHNANGGKPPLRSCERYTAIPSATPTPSHSPAIAAAASP
jgi:hypothetical protein